jgi:Uridine kinase
MEPATKIIGLSGKIGSGKTAVALAIQEAFTGGKSYRIGYGDLLKEEVSRRFNFPISHCYDSKGITIPLTEARAAQGMTRAMTVRELLQWYGTDVIRAKSINHWAVALRDRIDGLDAALVVIDDVRFPNEVDLIRMLGGIVVRLEPFRGHVAPVDGTDHPSEVALDDYRDWDMLFRPGYGAFEAAAKSILVYQEGLHM